MGLSDATSSGQDAIIAPDRSRSGEPQGQVQGWTENSRQPRFAGHRVYLDGISGRLFHYHVGLRMGM